MAKEKFGVAVDIGTTGIVAALVSESGEILRERACVNSGARFGADVMSRIRAAAEGQATELRALLRADITELIGALLRSAPQDRADPAGKSAPPAGDTDEAGARRVEAAAVRVVVFAGNTAMLHILNGYDCGGLGKHPYTPVSLALEECAVEEVLPDLPALFSDARVVMLPGISAFVGADIVAGLYALDVMKLPPGGTALFLDLGTNGEMALIRRAASDAAREGRANAGQTGTASAEIAVCSTAAGPVFEGAGIRFGMRGGPGAIDEVVIVPGHVGPAGEHPMMTRCRVIGNVPPVGICGSGVLEAVAELARLRLIDRDGLLSEPWFSEGFLLAKTVGGAGDTNGAESGEIRLYQEDIRAVQLAKAAIRAGAETLPLACGMPAREIDTVLVAGAFGGALPFSRLAPLGMFPPPLLKKCRAVGNTSLAGAVKTLAAALRGESAEAFAALDAIVRAAAEVPLAGRQDFEACYLAMMGF